MTTDEGRELLCNIQGPIAARLIAISQARFAAGGSTNIISIFRRSSRPICRSLDSLQEMAGPPPSPCASHSEVSGRLGTRKFDQMRIKICFSPIKPLQILQRPVSYGSLFRISAHISGWPRRCENNKRKAHFGIRLVNGLPGMVAFMMLVPGSGQGWKTAFKTPMIASGGTANELHG